MEYIFEIYTKLFFDLYDPLCGLKGYNLKSTKQYGLLNSKNYIGTLVLLNANLKKKKELKFCKQKYPKKKDRRVKIW